MNEHQFSKSGTQPEQSHFELNRNKPEAEELGALLSVPHFGDISACDLSHVINRVNTETAGDPATETREQTEVPTFEEFRNWWHKSWEQLGYSQRQRESLTYNPLYGPTNKHANPSGLHSTIVSGLVSPQEGGFSLNNTIGTLSHRSEDFRSHGGIWPYTSTFEIGIAVSTSHPIEQMAETYIERLLSLGLKPQDLVVEVWGGGYVLGVPPGRENSYPDVGVALYYSENPDQSGNAPKTIPENAIYFPRPSKLIEVFQSCGIQVVEISDNSTFNYPGHFNFDPVGYRVEVYVNIPTKEGNKKVEIGVFEHLSHFEDRTSLSGSGMRPLDEDYNLHEIELAIEQRVDQGLDGSGDDRSVLSIIRSQNNPEQETVPAALPKGGSINICAIGMDRLYAVLTGQRPGFTEIEELVLNTLIESGSLSRNELIEDDLKMLASGVDAFRTLCIFFGEVKEIGRNPCSDIRKRALNRWFEVCKYFDLDPNDSRIWDASYRIIRDHFQSIQIDGENAGWDLNDLSLKQRGEAAIYINERERKNK